MSDEAVRDQPAGRAALLDRYLERGGPLVPAPAAAPAMPQLVGYLAGVLGAEEAREVERGLLAHPASRARLRAALTCLDALQVLPLPELERQAEGSGFEGDVARSWRDVLEAQARAASGTGESTARGGWNAWRRRLAEGAAEAVAAWTGLAALGEQMRSALALQAPAAACGPGELPLLEAGLPPGLHAALAGGEIDVDGVLRVSVEFQDESGAPDAGLAGQPVVLFLRFQAHAWELGTAVVEGAEAHWDLPGFAELSRLPPQQTPPGFFYVAYGDPPTPHPAEPILLLGEHSPAGSGRREKAPCEVWLRMAPRWEEGTLLLTVELPAGTRAACADCVLELALALSPRAEQHLGRWPVVEWGEAPRLLEIPGAGGWSGGLAYPSLLRARFRPRGG